MSLTSPIPTGDKKHNPRYQFDIEERILLPRPPNLGIVDFDELLIDRHSRTPQKIPSADAVSSLLWYTLKSRRIEKHEEGRQWIHCGIPSSGGLHAVNTLLVSSETPSKLFLYERHSHRLDRLKVENTLFYDHSLQLINWKGYLFVHIADMDLIGKYYENAQSLVLRDSGVINGCMSWVSAALNISFRPLGTTFNEQVRETFKNSSILGVGGAVFGL